MNTYSIPGILQHVHSGPRVELTFQPGSAAVTPIKVISPAAVQTGAVEEEESAVCPQAECLASLSPCFLICKSEIGKTLSPFLWVEGQSWQKLGGTVPPIQGGGHPGETSPPVPVTGAPALKLLKPRLQAQSTPLKDTSLSGKEHSSESMERQSSPGAPG